eukprot:COSAG01_NODE_170_length_23136_cov_24.853931_18_plen_74_part_00
MLVVGRWLPRSERKRRRRSEPTRREAAAADDAAAEAPSECLVPLATSSILPWAARRSTGDGMTPPSLARALLL